MPDTKRDHVTGALPDTVDGRPFMGSTRRSAADALRVASSAVGRDLAARFFAVDARRLMPDAAEDALRGLSVADAELAVMARRYFEDGVH